MVKGFNSLDKEVMSPPKKARVGGNDDGAVPTFAIPSGESASKVRLPASAAIQIVFFKFSDDSSMFSIPGRPEPLIGAIYDHGAFPSIFYKENTAKDRFCAETHKSDKTFPASGKDLDAQNGMRWVMSPSEATFPGVPYRRGMYMKRSKVLWFVDYMDTFCTWRQVKGDDGDYGDLSIEVTNATDFTFDVSSKKYECNVVWKKVADLASLPFHVLSIPSPAWSKLLPHVCFEAVDATHLDIRCSGDTLSFKTPFNDFNVFGRYEAMDGSPLSEEASTYDKRQGQYVRILKNVDISDEPYKNFVLELLKNSVYKGTLLVMEWIESSDDNDGDEMQAFPKDEMQAFKKEVLALKHVFQKEDLEEHLNRGHETARPVIQ